MNPKEIADMQKNKTKETNDSLNDLVESIESGIKSLENSAGMDELGFETSENSAGLGVENKKKRKVSKSDTAEIMLPYGLKDGRLIHISAVESGIDCNCTCPECGETLIARKGDVKQHHFAHKADSNGETRSCKHAIETIAHMLAKDVILSYREIVLPAIDVDVVKFKFLKLDGGHVVDYKRITYEKVEAEQTVKTDSDKTLRPDIMIERNGQKCYIEIAVTNRVDKRKLAKLREMDIPTFEIRIKPEDINLPYNDFVQLVLLNMQNRKWVYNPIINKVNDYLDTITEGVPASEERGLVLVCKDNPDNSFNVTERDLIKCRGGIDAYGKKIRPCWYFRGELANPTGNVNFPLMRCWANVEQTNMGTVERMIEGLLMEYMWR